MREKRRHPRKKIDVRVTIEIVEGEILDGRMTNIALGGAFVEVATTAGLGTPATLRVAFPASNFESKIGCTVRWVIASGIGLEFGSMGARDTHALVTAIENASELAD
jgi:hypothetical protein